jgi:hypothetical protein
MHRAHIPTMRWDIAKEGSLIRNVDRINACVLKSKKSN